MILNLRKTPRSNKGQTAMEYILLLMIVAIVVLNALKHLTPKARDYSEVFFNKAAQSVAGQPPDIPASNPVNP